MKIFTVQENGPYGIEGEVHYYTDEAMAKRRLCLLIFIGTEMGDKTDLSFQEVEEMIDWMGSSWTMGWSEDQDDLYRQFRQDNPSGTFDEFYSEFASDMGNTLFEGGVVDTDTIDNHRDDDLYKTIVG